MRFTAKAREATFICSLIYKNIMPPRNNLKALEFPPFTD